MRFELLCGIEGLELDTDTRLSFPRPDFHGVVVDLWRPQTVNDAELLAGGPEGADWVIGCGVSSDHEVPPQVHLMFTRLVREGKILPDLGSYTRLKNEGRVLPAQEEGWRAQDKAFWDSYYKSSDPVMPREPVVDPWQTLPQELREFRD
jgi:hypothetical protein